MLRPQAHDLRLRALVRPHHRLTHAVPLKQVPALQSQTRTSWLASGEQPQAPIEQVSGKSVVLAQHWAVITVPPDPRQPCSGVHGQPFSALLTAVRISSMVILPS